MFWEIYTDFIQVVAHVNFEVALNFFYSELRFCGCASEYP